MSQKILDTQHIASELHASRFFQPVKAAALPQSDSLNKPEQSTSISTQNPTLKRERSRHIPRKPSRTAASGFLTRDEVQEFSFRLRDTFKVKVQAEVPHEWQDELEEVARKLKVKKLELYRYILGEFLGKVKRHTQP